MPFGLTNAPASFQRLMNTILHDLLDVTCVVYLDDILVFSEDPAQHVAHCREVLRRLVANNLYVKAEKCEFSVTTTAFLGHIVSTKGLSMDPARVSAILDWPQPTCLKHLLQFLGFANHYRRYIDDYATLAQPLNRLTTKLATASPFTFPAAAVSAFAALKSRFTSTPLLRHFHPDLPTMIETDSSGYAISAILSQTHLTSHGPRQHPIAYFSRKTSPAERNYGICDSEMLAIACAIRNW